MQKWIRLLLAFVLIFHLIGKARSETYYPLKHLWYGTRDIPNTQNYIMFGVGGALALIAIPFNQKVNNYFAGKDRLANWDNTSNAIWQSAAGAIIGVGVLSVGLIWYKPHEVDTGEAMLEGQVANGIYTQLVKLLANTNRPNGGSLSFPSGHTSSAFATSACLMDMYGPAVGVPMLAISAFAGLSRLASNEHWLSDVIFGATMGYIVGHSYTLHHQNKSSDLDLTLVPYYDSRQNFGLTALLRF